MRIIKSIILHFCVFGLQFQVFGQNKSNFEIPQMPNPELRMAVLQNEWAALQQTPPQLAVRDGFMFLLDALDTRYLTPDQVEWTLKLLQTRVIPDENAKSFGNIYWGWTETGGDMGDGNNVEFCVQYGILIKLLFDDLLSTEARKTLDQIFELATIGIRNQPIRISYTNIYLMRIWNLVAIGKAYQNNSVILFNVDGVEIGKPIMEKYKEN